MKKTAKMQQTVKIKTIVELAELGYKEKDGGIYIGEARYPTHQLTQRQMHILGATVKVVDVCDGSVKIEDSNESDFWVNNVFINGPLPKRGKVEKVIVFDGIAKFNGYKFDFPCELRTCSREDAIRLANWVLKVAK